MSNEGAAPTIQRVAAVEASGGGRGAQQQCQRAAFGGGEREPPHRDRVDFAGAHFADHRADGAAAQGFFHCPQQVAAMRDAHCHQPFGREAEGIEAGAMRCAAFGDAPCLR